MIKKGLLISADVLNERLDNLVESCAYSYDLMPIDDVRNLIESVAEESLYPKLRAEMKRQKISGNRLSMMALISPSDFYNAFNGRKPFCPSWRTRIADALNVAEEDIF